MEQIEIPICSQCQEDELVYVSEFQFVACKKCGSVFNIKDEEAHDWMLDLFFRANRISKDGKTQEEE